jgi:hypothetical protein
MNVKTESATNQLDTAAVFACAFSLWNACKTYANGDRLNLSDCYNGMDELIRVVSC